MADIEEIITADNDPATIAWRNNRLRLWDLIRKRRDDDYNGALKHTTPEKARDYANSRARPEVMAFLPEILRNCTLQAATDFLANAPDFNTIISRPETLLDSGETVPRLIRRSFPNASWGAKLVELQKEKAKIDTDWVAWADHWYTTVRQEIGVQVDAATQGASDFADVLRKVVKYGPAIAVGTVGLVVVLVVAGRK